MTSSTPAVPHIRHQSGAMRFQIITTTIIGCAFLLITVIEAIRSLRQFEIALPLLSLVSAVIWVSLFNAVTIIETRPEGLFVGHLLRRDRVIPWPSMRRIYVSFGRGHSCTIQTGKHFYQAI